LVFDFFSLKTLKIHSLHSFFTVKPIFYHDEPDVQSKKLVIRGTENVRETKKSRDYRGFKLKASK